ncbi:MAG TPA: zf-TFIIB domain-containing protein [Streptosporangiaceae bacterium]|nr:zf-TFIIB domain-containing protein [Streptosporangiaceae bacterium]
MSALTCPKCHGQMRQYERHGVYVDQCTECRGIFLDRGELEQLIDAEARWGAGPPAPLVGGDWDDDPRRHQGLGGHQTSQHKKRKRSFLEGLFDD